MNLRFWFAFTFALFGTLAGITALQNERDIPSYVPGTVHLKGSALQ